MLKLCICDDNPEDIEKVRELVMCFSQVYPQHPVSLSSFQSPYTLMDHLRKNSGFDLYLLDMLMPQMNGLSLARQIRERSEPSEILFLTISREYAVEAFDVRAAGYLLKPVAQDAFDRTLLDAIAALAPKSDPALLLKTTMGIRKIPLKSLVIIESFNHRRRCTLADGTFLETPDTLASFLERLADDGRFFSPHRAYIVNLQYVNGLTATDLLLADGKRVPVSRNLYSALKTAYLNYTF